MLGIKKWLVFSLFLSSLNAKSLFLQGIVKKDIGLTPLQLVTEYVKRDAKGDFLKTNDWWNSAVACPECMGGPDTFTVISEYKVKQLSPLKFLVGYSVEGEISGTAVGNSFTPSKTTKKIEFTVVKTKWGNKLDSKAFQMVSANVVANSYGASLPAADLKKLEAIQVTAH